MREQGSPCLWLVLQGEQLGKSKVDEVKWTPGHMDIVGNEKSDEEAIKAAIEGSSPIGKLPLPAPLRKTLP